MFHAQPTIYPVLPTHTKVIADEEPSKICPNQGFPNLPDSLDDRNLAFATTNQRAVRLEHDSTYLVERLDGGLVNFDGS